MCLTCRGGDSIGLISINEEPDLTPSQAPSASTAHTTDETRAGESTIPRDSWCDRTRFAAKRRIFPYNRSGIDRYVLERDSFTRSSRMTRPSPSARDEGYFRPPLRARRRRLSLSLLRSPRSDEFHSERDCVPGRREGRRRWTDN